MLTHPTYIIPVIALTPHSPLDRSKVILVRSDQVLADAIEKKMGIALALQLLELNGMFLPSTATLMDLGIFTPADILVHINFHGGGPKRKRRVLEDSDEKTHTKRQEMMSYRNLSLIHI